MPMMRHYVFGYGSLVNVRTHPAAGPPARLPGWRREWCQTCLRPVAFLSARRAAGHCIAGRLAEVENGDWAALDLREAAYRRHVVSTEAIDAHAPAQVQVYSIHESHRTAGSGAILLSYLDVVAQGFHDLFGAAGVEEFFETTDGWNRAVLCDRHAPRYRRHVSTDATVRNQVDAALSRLPAMMQELE